MNIEEIDRFCDLMEERLKAGDDVSLEDFLEENQLPRDARLLGELIKLERELRGDDADSEESYCHRFPEVNVDDVREGRGGSRYDYETASLIGPGIEATSPWHREADSVDQKDKLLGSTIGDYEIQARIGRGGMGVVYKVRQKSLDRQVALKIIRTGEFADEEEVARFRAEAQAAAQLEHPNIVPIYEVGQADSLHFFSMAYIDGESLDLTIRNGPLSPQEAARITKTAADGIAHAHDNGVIHRDIKPANVLLDTEGQTRVTDFGLARRMNDDGGLTATGQILGTPSYMAPEQASGEKVTSSTDVYGLGAMLYCLLTGHPPFQAASLVGILRQVREQPPIPPRQLSSAIPRDLETITLKCLEKQPRQRYATAGDLSEDLGRWLDKKPIKARSIGRIGRTTRWCRRRPAIAALLATVVILLVSGLIVSTYFGISQYHALRDAKAALEGERIARNAEASARYGAELNGANTEMEIGRYDEARRRLDNTDWSKRAWDYELVRSLFERQCRLVYRDDHDIVDCEAIGKNSFVLIASGKNQNNSTVEYFLTAIDFESKRLVYRTRLSKVQAVSEGSDDGRYLAVAVEQPDGLSIVVYEPRSGFKKPRRVRVKDALAVTDLELSPNGEYLACACSDREIRVWKMTDLSRDSMVVPDSQILSVSWVDDSTLIGGDSTGHAHIWRLDAESAEVSRVAADFPIRLIKGVPGKPIVGVSNGEQVWFVDLEAGTQWQADLKTQTIHKLLVTRPDGQVAIVSDRGISVVLPRGGTVVREVISPDGTCTSAAFLDYSNVMLSSIEGKLFKVSLWNDVPRRFQEDSLITAVALSPDASRAGLGMIDGTLVVVDPQSGERLQSANLGDTVTSIAFDSRDSSKVAAGTSGGNIIIFDRSLQQLGQLKIDTPVAELVFTHQGNRVFIAGRDYVYRGWGKRNFRTWQNSFSAWDFAEGTRFDVRDFDPSMKAPSGLLPNRSENIVTGLIGGNVWLFDADNGMGLGMINGVFPYRAIGVSTDDRKLAVANSDGTIAVLEIDLRSPQSCREWFETHGRVTDGGPPSVAPETDVQFKASTDVCQLLFHPEGTRLLAVATNGEIAILDIESNVRTLRLSTTPSPRCKLAFGQDGQLVCISSGHPADARPFRIRIRETTSDKDLLLLVRNRKVIQMDFCKNDRYFAFRNVDDMIEVWDIKNKKQVWHRFGRGFDLHDSGMQIAVQTSDHRVELWDLANGKRTAEIARADKKLGSLVDVQFAPDSPFIALAYENAILIFGLNGVDGNVRIGVESGGERFAGWLYADNNRLLTWANEHLVVWDASSGNQLGEYEIAEYVGKHSVAAHDQEIVWTDSLGLPGKTVRGERTSIPADSRDFYRAYSIDADPYGVVLSIGTTLAMTAEGWRQAVFDLGNGKTLIRNLDKGEAVAEIPTAGYTRCCLSKSGEVVGIVDQTQPLDVSPGWPSFSIAAIGPSRSWRSSTWTVNKQTEAKELYGHRLPVFDIAHSSDGQYLSTVDGNLTVWDVIRGRRVSALASSVQANRLGFLGSDVFVLNGHDNMFVMRRSDEGGFAAPETLGGKPYDRTKYLKAYVLGLRRFVLSESAGNVIFVNDGVIKKVDYQRSELKWAVNADKARPYHGVSGTDGADVVACWREYDEVIELRSVESGGLQGRISLEDLSVKGQALKSPHVSDIVLSPKGKLLFVGISAHFPNSGSPLGGVAVFDLARRNCIEFLPCPWDMGPCLTISQNGTRIAACGDSVSKVLVWDTISREIIGARSIEGGREDISALSLSPDGASLAIGCFSGRLFYWRIDKSPGNAEEVIGEHNYPWGSDVTGGYGDPSLIERLHGNEPERSSTQDSKEPPEPMPQGY